jgi:hypothetical protein
VCSVTLYLRTFLMPSNLELSDTQVYEPSIRTRLVLENDSVTVYIPQTLLSTHCTPHPTHYTLHTTHYTLHTTPFTAHPPPQSPIRCYPEAFAELNQPRIWTWLVFSLLPTVTTIFDGDNFLKGSTLEETYGWQCHLISQNVLVKCF